MITDIIFINVIDKEIKSILIFSKALRAPVIELHLAKSDYKEESWLTFVNNVQGSCFLSNTPYDDPSIRNTMKIV